MAKTNMAALRWLAEKRWRVVSELDYFAAEVASLIKVGYAVRRGCNVYVTDAGRASLHKSEDRKI